MAKDRYKAFVEDGGLNRVYLMRMQGSQDKEIFQALRISKQTFYKWIRDHADFADVYKKGKDDAISDAIRALTSKFHKQTLTETRTETWTNADGYIREHTTVITRDVAPDTAAIIFYLKAQAGWRENKEIVDASALEKLDLILQQTQSQAEEEEGNEALEETA